MTLSPDTILQNRYRIVRELGHGGMGTVYEAVDQRVNSIVALKETTATRDGEARRAFEREAALLANLRHQALPKVMDFFSEMDGDFLVMEFIPGYDLAELLELRDSPFPQSQVFRWANDLLRVLEYLHGQEPPILHRDIKPSNLKLTKQGEIFLLDFGLAKGAAGQMPTLVTSRSVRGYTPVYASLEQIHGHGTDARSDLYSLGATLYHLLAGIAPVDAPARFHAVEDDEPDPLKPIQDLNPQATTNVCEVIQQALAVSRKQRPIGAAEMRKALRNAAEEDERQSAEEEYRLAEQRRRERNEEKRRAEEEAAVRAERERELQEAETRKKEARERDQEKRRQEADARRRVEELEAQRRSEEEREREAQERQQPLSQPTVPAPTVRSKAPQTPVDLSAVSQPTLPSPPPERFTTDQLAARETIRPEEASTSGNTRNRSLIAAAIVVVLIGGILGVWLMKRNGTPSTVNSQTAQTQSANAAPTLNTKPVAPEGMVYVPGGTFMMGRDDGDESERPAHQTSVPQFFIDIHEVTLGEYDKFVKATGKHGTPPYFAALRFFDSSVNNYRNRPVTGANWNDADAYCVWVKKRLPTEEEWEFAARGTDGRRYPWGNEWKTGLANANSVRNDVFNVGAFNGASPFGIFDMAGNAWEWTASNFQAYPGGHLPANLPTGDLKVIRGGSYESTREYATTTYRAGWPRLDAKTYSQTGFRCAQDVQ